MQMIAALQQKVIKKSSRSIDINDEVLGHKVSLPMFSRGLQGIVSGIFTDVPKAKLEPILTSILQFGETISDAYADLRWQAFASALQNDLSEEKLAREVVNVVSPVAKIIVKRGDHRIGFKIADESIYWAGYQTLSKQELASESFMKGFTVTGPKHTEIYIEPIADIPNLNPEFARVRLENALQHTFAAIAPPPPSGLALAFSDVRALREDFEAYTREDEPSLAKLKQYYVVQKSKNIGTAVG